MNQQMFRLILIFFIIILVTRIRKSIRKKVVQPKTIDGVQSPGTFDRFIMKLVVGLTIFALVFTILGVFIGEVEMAIVFFVVTLIFAGIVLLLRHEYNMTYQENEEYFVLDAKNKHYQVYYKNIVDWRPSLNEIRILDETREDQKFIRVNIAMIRPEKLLGKMVEMTFEGKFSHTASIDSADPNRENEMINFLIQNNYEHLLEGYVER